MSSPCQQYIGEAHEILRMEDVLPRDIFGHLLLAFNGLFDLVHLKLSMFTRDVWTPQAYYALQGLFTLTYIR
jgi:hypothetical protein